MSPCLGWPFNHTPMLRPVPHVCGTVDSISRIRLDLRQPAYHVLVYARRPAYLFLLRVASSSPAEGCHGCRPALFVCPHQEQPWISNLWSVCPYLAACIAILHGTGVCLYPHPEPFTRDLQAVSTPTPYGKDSRNLLAPTLSLTPSAAPRCSVVLVLYFAVKCEIHIHNQRTTGTGPRPRQDERTAASLAQRPCDSVPSCCKVMNLRS